jgi:oxygen-independent coproporphyrinogen III oxidase
MRETSTENGELGVYVHTPFCERVCPYCDFAVEAARELAPELEQRFVDDLLADLALARAELPALQGRRALATVYFGGGTPSRLQPESIARVLAALGAAFRGPAREVTLELNPVDAELARVAEFRAAGITRLSVGLQSLHDGTLKRLGRAHAGAEALAGLEHCLAAGFASLSIDLIYGAPGQSEAELMADVDRVIDLGVDHVSAYALTIEPGTPFAKARDAGRLELPPEDLPRRLGRLLRARLVAAGLAAYEISSFARPDHRSQHNQRYWLRQDVLGIGPSAASLVAEHRFQNARERGTWQAAVRAGRRELIEDAPVPLEERRRETLALGFRRPEGVSRATWLRAFGAPPETWFAAELRELAELELIAERAGRLRLTERGMLFADEVFLRFTGR